MPSPIRKMTFLTGELDFASSFDSLGPEQAARQMIEAEITSANFFIVYIVIVEWKLFNESVHHNYDKPS